MIDTAALTFTDAPLVMTGEERRVVSELVHEYAGRLERETKPTARKRAARFHAIASFINEGSAL